LAYTVAYLRGIADHARQMQYTAAVKLPYSSAARAGMLSLKETVPHEKSLIISRSRVASALLPPDAGIDIRGLVAELSIYSCNAKQVVAALEGLVQMQAHLETKNMAMQIAYMDKHWEGTFDISISVPGVGTVGWAASTFGSVGGLPAIFIATFQGIALRGDEAIKKMNWPRELARALRSFPNNGIGCFMVDPAHNPHEYSTRLPSAIYENFFEPQEKIWLSGFGTDQSGHSMIFYEAGWHGSGTYAVAPIKNKTNKLA